EMITLQRQVAWQYDIDRFTNSQIQSIRRAVNIAKTDVMGYLDRLNVGEWTEDRLNVVLAEIRALSLGVEGQITDGLSEGFVTAGREALAAQNNMLSFGGRIQNFNFAAIGPGQLASMAVNTPVGGQLLNSWVKRTFDKKILGQLREEALAALIKGEAYPAFIKRVSGMFTNLSKTEITTLARSYIQAANVNAQIEVYRQNPEIVQYVKWSAVLEPGYYKTGRGTCIRCAGLDGQIFRLDENPPIPLHPRCRCVLLPVTPSYQELGLDIDEIRDSYRPYTMRPDKNIDAGGTRKILEVGFHQGDYESWFKKRPVSFQKNVLGPSRLKLYQSGKFKFKQFVNNSTGELFTLDELKGFTGPNPPTGFSPKGALKPKTKKPVLQPTKTIPKVPKVDSPYGIPEYPEISNAFDYSRYSLKKPPSEIIYANQMLKKHLETPLKSISYVSGTVGEGGRNLAVYSKSLDGMKINVTNLKKVKKAPVGRKVPSYQEQLETNKESLKKWEAWPAKSKADIKKKRGSINRLKTNIRNTERKILAGEQAVPFNATAFTKDKLEAIENSMLHELGHRSQDSYDMTRNNAFFRRGDFPTEYSKTNANEYWSEVYSLAKMDLLDNTLMSKEAKAYYKKLIGLD
ncbi:MAG: hypothetical protein KAS39_00050, partial [Actinomycetia bacterium]|nr:hypothetical protein [Actinomycetes bacterium]